MTATVLLTGGFGTLGGRLAERLARHGQVRLVLGTRTPAAPPAWAPRAEVRRTDWASEATLAPALAGVTHVVHLAAMNDVDCAADAAAAETVNVRHTERLVREAARAGVGRLVYASTIQVYGSPPPEFVDETTTPRPANAYAATHLRAEEVVAGAGGVRLRLANGFGAPVSRDARIWQVVVNDLCRGAAERGEMRLTSSGRQYRNFIPFADSVAALEWAALAPAPDVTDGLYNVGGERTMTLLEMAERIAARCAATLGTRPTLRRGADDPRAPHAPFTVDSSRVRRAGAPLTGDLDGELDRLLLACREWFAGGGG
jgi:UDP-glucose 4-epimerase